MYQAHFGLSQEPFSIAPDPQFLFLSESHNEALAHLMYGFSHGGFVLITGEVGTGKTTLLRNLLDRTPTDLDVAFILNPRLTVKELLETLCDELGVPYNPSESHSVKQYIDRLNKHLLQTHQAGRSTVVIIDEAQNLSPAVLEQIRLLTNLETNDKKLIRMILIGQPELGVMLDRTELRQLAQRITARYHLKTLSKDDVSAYVTHRLARAGGNPGIFTPGAITALYRKTKGTPRLINVIADRAMLAAYVEGGYQITPRLVSLAAKEVFGTRPTPRKTYYAIAGAAVAVIGAIMLWAVLALPDNPDDMGDIAAQPPATLNLPQRASQQRPVQQDPPPPAAVNLERESEQIEPTPSVDFSRPAGRMSTLQRTAFRAVFAEWGADYPTSSDLIPCDYAPRVGLQCLSRKGGWSEIQQLNLPVVLELWDDKPVPYYGALLPGSTASNGNYELQIGDRNMPVTPRDLRDNWFGAYVVLWQTPPRYNGSLRLGDNHPTVRWLHEKLAILDGADALGPPSSQFSQPLHEAVLRFQQAEGLLADGIVGPLTWIRLSDRLDLPAPKLNLVSSFSG
jgi:general secretion pathway protein A